MKKNELYEIVTHSTGITLDSSTLIDHVIANNKNIWCKIDYTPKISDLATKKISLGFDILNVDKEMMISRRNYKKYQFQEIVKGTDWKCTEYMQAIYTRDPNVWEEYKQIMNRLTFEIRMVKKKQTLLTTIRQIKRKYGVL